MNIEIEKLIFDWKDLNGKTLKNLSTTDKTYFEDEEITVVTGYEQSTGKCWVLHTETNKIK